MIQKTTHYDKDTVVSQAQGRAEEILLYFGVPAQSLTGKHCECPKCGGKDRCRFDSAKGFLICNQCFNKGNGDVISAVQWWLECSFSEAVNRIGEYLNVSHSQPVKKQKPPAKKKPLIDQIQILDQDWDKFSELAAHKPPATPEAVEAAGAKLCSWPAWRPESERFECVAFPAYNGTGEPSAWILYRVDGQHFPATKTAGERKTHLLAGSKDGLIFFGDRASFLSAETVIKAEGLPDALAIYSQLPEGFTVITNVCGAKGAAIKC
ncbi:hypothetical protein F1728_22960 [Gimesia benthica]|uniref:DNA primase/helicase Gp4 N-terminal Bacteriophage T7-like domain-containing protein n=1 Tax=Gimesia benthica TaxID=2608982 RepID=A0A6I6AGG7_9PLAN|nr:primase-helicase zinc-binding domain-containing protein [Gimesia benthica]QGQ25368.1 hypothetical protein F1728_22960 [Gimesia benthica]